MNSALLGKWAWRIAVEKDALWNLVVSGKYGATHANWWPKDSSYYKASHIWKGIIKNKNPVIANGRHILIHKCGFASSTQYVWDINCTRNLYDDEVEEFMALHNYISNSKISFSQPDSIEWRVDKSATFSVRSLYFVLYSAGSPLSDATPFVWKYHVPPKVGCFGWLAARNRILTINNLAKRGMQIANICLCCMRQVESVNHLLVHCFFTSSILSHVCDLFSLSWCAPESAAELLIAWNGVKS